MSVTPSSEQIERLVSKGLEFAYESNRYFDRMRFCKEQVRQTKSELQTPTGPGNFRWAEDIDRLTEHLESMESSLVLAEDKFKLYSTMAGFLLGPGSIGGDVLESESERTNHP